MHIGLNLLYLLPGIVGGTETYAQGLLQGLAQVDGQNEYLVFVNAESTDWPIPQAPNFRRVVCPVRAAGRIRRLAFEQYTLPRLVERSQADLLHSLGYVAPQALPCPGVVTIHDMNTKVHGRSMGFFKRLLLAALVRRSAQSSSHVITVSEFSRQEIIKHLNLAPAKITMIHEAPLPVQRAATPSGTPTIPQPYILTLASLSPHKNIPRLIEAFALLAGNLPHQLVLAGHLPPDGRIHQAIAGHDLASRVTLTGWLPQEQVQALLAGTDLFVFPSLYEGFGLPVLEAQSQGAVIACADRGALSEVAADGAFFFDPESTRSIVEAIQRCLTDETLRRNLRERAVSNISRFSWTRAARETLAVYERAVARKTGP